MQRASAQLIDDLIALHDETKARLSELSSEEKLLLANWAALLHDNMVDQLAPDRCAGPYWRQWGSVKAEAAARSEPTGKRGRPPNYEYKPCNITKSLRLGPPDESQQQKQHRICGVCYKAYTRDKEAGLFSGGGAAANKRSKNASDD